MGGGCLLYLCTTGQGHFWSPEKRLGWAVKGQGNMSGSEYKTHSRIPQSSCWHNALQPCCCWGAGWVYKQPSTERLTQCTKNRKAAALGSKAPPSPAWNPYQRCQFSAEPWCLSSPSSSSLPSPPSSPGRLTLICLQLAETKVTGLAAGTEEICAVNSSLSCEMNKLGVEKEIQAKSTFPVLIKLFPFVVYFWMLILERLSSFLFSELDNRANLRYHGVIYPC